jgi:hypothetical protein
MLGAGLRVKRAHQVDLTTAISIGQRGQLFMFETGVGLILFAT